MNTRVSPTVVYAVALVLAACSLLYELLIAQTLATLAANTVVWYSVTIGVYLAAMGVGALAHERFAAGNLWVRLFRVELGLSVVGALAVPILHFTHSGGLLLTYNDLVLHSNLVFFGSAFVLIATIGVLTGFELPLLIDLANAASTERRVTNRVLAADYMGSLLAGLLFPLLLMPILGLIVIGLLTAAVNLVIAFIALRWLLPKQDRRGQRLVAGGTIAGLILSALYFAQPIEAYFVKNYYFYSNHLKDLPGLLLSLDNVDDVQRERSPYQRIDLVYDEAGYDSDIIIDFYSTKFVQKPTQPRNYVLFLNGDFQVTSNYEDYYHEYFAHVPIANAGKTPRRVLVMGAGDGLLIRELVKYPEIESIVQVDLDPKLVEMAKTHPVLRAMNEGALEDPRLEIHLDDAFRYIRNSTETFDAIYLDFPYVEDYNLSKLYSREFFHFVRKRLAADGFVVMDTPGIDFDEELREIYLNTMIAAGYQYIKPYVSTVERENPEAFKMLMESGYKRVKARRFLIEHSYAVSNGFLLAGNRAPELPSYLDPDLPLHVLNEERLQLTFERRIPVLMKTEADKVNSIFRPTLPAEDIWEIRRAW